MSAATLTRTVDIFEKEFPGRADKVATARNWVTARTPRTRAARKRRDDIALCVSEMATNAVYHSMSGAHGGTYTITVAVSGDRMTVKLTDLGPSLAVEVDPSLVIRPRFSADGIKETGYGLDLLAVCADEFFRDGNSAVAVFTF